MEKIVFILDGMEKTTYVVGCSVKDFNKTKNMTDNSFDYFSNSEINWVITDYTNDDDEKNEFKNNISQQFNKKYQIVYVSSDNQKIVEKNDTLLVNNQTKINQFVEQIKQTFK